MLSENIFRSLCGLDDRMSSASCEKRYKGEELYKARTVGGEHTCAAILHELVVQLIPISVAKGLLWGIHIPQPTPNNKVQIRRTSATGAGSRS